MFKGFKDISGYPLEEGNLVKIVNDKKHYTIQIGSVEKVDDCIRLIDCVVIESNNTEVALNTRLKLKLDSNIPTYGIVMTATNSETGTELTPIQVNTVIALELKKFLDSREGNNYGARIDVALSFLIASGLLTDSDGLGQAKKRLLRIIRMRKDIFRNVGGFVFSVGEDESLPFTAPNLQNTKIVDWVQCERMLLAFTRSGLMGDVRVINLPEHLK